MMALVDNNLTVLGDQVPNFSFAVETLNDGDVYLTARIPLSAPDLTDRLPRQMGIHLTQVTPRCRILGNGRLSPESGRVRGAFRQRAGLSGVSVSAPLEIVPNLVDAVLKPGSLRESSKPFTTKENRREETISHSGFREATASQPQRPHPPAQPKLPTHAALVDAGMTKLGRCGRRCWSARAAGIKPRRQQQDDERLGARMLDILMKGVSTRNYAQYFKTPASPSRVGFEPCGGSPARRTGRVHWDCSGCWAWAAQAKAAIRAAWRLGAQDGQARLEDGLDLVAQASAVALWCGPDAMVCRWATAAFLDTEKSFRKIMGYKDLWMLDAILNPAKATAAKAA